MKIILLSRFDPRDINNWSGTLYYIYQKLKEKHQVEIIGGELLNQLSRFALRNFSSKITVPSNRYINSLGHLLTERINEKRGDLIFFGDLLFIPSELNIPFVLLSDMTFDQVKVHYLKTKWQKDDEVFLNNIEKLLLNHAVRIIYSSEWTKQKAIEYYHLDPSKIEVVEFGANIPNPTNYLIDINMDVCRLVFIGMDWERKNGDTMLQIFDLLKKDGFPCTLTIIGSVPENEVTEDDDLSIIPFLDKSDPDDLQRLCNILYDSHFLVLPTKFDAFGIVFCEASAYALPSIASNVGGVGQAIKEGENGYLLPADASAYDYAEKIITVFRDREGYIKLRQSSRYEYETRLNWDVWGEKVNKIFEDAVNEYKIVNNE